MRRSSPQGRIRSRALAIVTAAGLGLMVVGAIVFTMASGTADLARRSQRLHMTNETLRLATVARAQVGLAVHLAAISVAYAAPVDDALGKSLDEAGEALGQIELVKPSGGTGEAEARAFTSVARTVRDDLAAGDVGEAQRLAEAELDASFKALVAVLDTARAEELEEIIAADRMSARLGDLGRFLVVLIIPLALVLGYREIVSRRMRQQELEMRLSAERELARARDEFIANASHELRTPLTAIYGLGQLLEEDETLPYEAREMLRMMNTESADLARMVDDLLTTARLAAGQLRYEPDDVDVVSESETICQPFLQAGHPVVIDVAPATVWADRLRQRQVLRNLISNATKYGGDEIRLLGAPDGGWYQWVVADDGPGVPKELEHRLFQRYIHTLTFQQAVAGGVGLGLSIVKSLTEGMGGTIDYQRVDGETRFIVRLPLSANTDSGINADLRRVVIR